MIIFRIAFNVKLHYLIFALICKPRWQQHWLGRISSCKLNTPYKILLPHGHGSCLWNIAKLICTWDLLGYQFASRSSHSQKDSWWPNTWYLRIHQQWKAHKLGDVSYLLPQVSKRRLSSQLWWNIRQVRWTTLLSMQSVPCWVLGTHAPCIFWWLHPKNLSKSSQPMIFEFGPWYECVRWDTFLIEIITTKKELMQPVKNAQRLLWRVLNYPGLLNPFYLAKNFLVF